MDKLLFFFFSSRRRHTRFSRDWSSDVCSSDLVGRSIAVELLENGHEVLLVDKEPHRIAVDELPRAEWLLADACEIASLDEAGLQRCNVVIAATGDDKVNLVVSLLAKTEYGVPRVVARVYHPKNGC